MGPDGMQSHLHKFPFQPIRALVSDGSSYDVLHHDCMVVSRTEVVIGPSAGPDEIPERIAYIEPVHITRREPINGKHPRGGGRRPR